MSWYKRDEKIPFYPSLYEQNDLMDFRREKEVIRLKIDGTPVDKATLTVLKDEARQLQSMRLWELLQKRLRVMAMTQALNTSKNWDEVLAAKAAADHVNLMDSILKAVLDAQAD